MSGPGEYDDPGYAAAARAYIWRTTRKVFPRGITPTDIDSFVEINGCFWFFEGKTLGTKIPNGQFNGLSRLVVATGSQSVLVLGEHPPMDEVNIYTNLTQVGFGYNQRGRFIWSPLTISGAGCLWALCDMFVKDAEMLGHLEPETWEARLEHDGRPFEEGVA